MAVKEATKEAERGQDPSNVVQYRPVAVATSRRSSENLLKMPTLGQLMDVQFKPRQYLLAPWLREQESCMVYAATGVGKSLFALSAAIAIAGDGEFLGWKPEAKKDGKPWRVLYVDGEMHVADIQERAQQLRAGIPLVDQGKAKDNLLFLARQHQHGGVQFPSITELAGQQFIVERIKDEHLNLVVLDNFSTLGEVEDENSAASFNAIQQFLLQLKVHEVATILVHHTGEAGRAGDRVSSQRRLKPLYNLSACNGLSGMAMGSL